MTYDDWQPQASWSTNRRRAELLAQVRAFFAARGLLEVETPLLSADTVVDRHLDPLVCVVPIDPREPNRGRRMFLQTSPEFGMKRLLATQTPEAPTGIYQITRAFRAGEAGPRHNPEFTIVEWYRVGDDYQAGQQLLSDLASELFGAGAERLSYRDAFRQAADVDPLVDEVAILAAAAKRLNLAPPASLADDDRDGWLDLILAGAVEPQLGSERPVILFDYPPSQAALAQVRSVAGQPAVAERFELYYRGVELANGYHELLDPESLRQRSRRNNSLREFDGKSTLPEESRLLSAMRAGLPACCGAALGLDRALMLLAGVDHIDHVLAFPTDRA